MKTNDLHVRTPGMQISDNYIEALYEYQTTKVQRNEGKTFKVQNVKTALKIRTDRRVPKLGVMLIGWGGNNGSTFTASLLANRRKLQWRKKTKVQQANWFGSITQASTVFLGIDEEGKNTCIAMKDMLPTIDPDSIVIDGWDISSVNIGDSMRRAQVLDVELQDQLYDELTKFKPRASIYDPDFIALNQSKRADNVIMGTKIEQFERIRKDIREFKRLSGLDKIIVLWTANTERFCEVKSGLNTNMNDLLKSLEDDCSEISPSTIFAMASIAEGCTYINGSPQNTFVPGVIEMADHYKVYIAGDDFKSGQTKLKSVLVDFLISAGIKPMSIVSYNHLGNNDGKNLSSPQQFRSKEISKSNVVDDMVESNNILYKPHERPDHVVVIKYVPYVGDSKRAMDEYISEIMMGGQNTLVIHNTCEDSLLAVPLILDLVILAELCSRITIKYADEHDSPWISFKSILSILSYMCKAPLVSKGEQVVNSLFRQRSAIENILRACIGLSPISNMDLEQRFDFQLLEPSPKKRKEEMI